MYSTQSVQNQKQVTWRWSWRRGHTCPRWLPWQTLEHQVRGRTQPHAELHPGGETVIDQQREREHKLETGQSVYSICFYVHVCMCLCVRTEAFSTLRKTPVDSTTYLAPALPQGISAGFILESERKQSQCKVKWVSLLSRTFTKVETEILMFSKRSERWS